MPFNGSGVFQRVYNWVNDANNNIKIRADRMDTETDGIATGLSTCITKDGQTTVTANLPMAGFKHTGIGNSNARNQYAATGQIQDQSFVWCSTAGGTANAQTLSPAPVITAYTAGQKFSFLPVATNTSGTVTIANSGLATRNVKKGIGGAKVILAVGDLIISVPAEVVDDGTDYILLNPQTYSHGADIASASTINLDTATGDYVYVTGTTGITAITLSEGREFTTKFSGIVTLTNGASLICPGAANFTTAAGDTIVWRGEASGVVRAVGGLKASGQAFVATVTISNPFNSVQKQVFTASGTYTPTANMKYCEVVAIGAGAGGGGAASGAGTAGGGGGGEVREATFTAAQIGASQTVTINNAGTGGASGDNDGVDGGTTVLGALLTANGGSKGRKGSVSTGGAGGTGGSGGISITGQAGQTGASVASSPYGGAGGGSPYGSGGAGGLANISNPVSGVGFGSGGGGAQGAGGNAAGGNGTKGLIKITEYISS